MSPAPCRAVRNVKVHALQGETTGVERFPRVRQYVLEFQNLVATMRAGVEFPWTLEVAHGTQAMIDLVRPNEG